MHIMTAHGPDLYENARTATRYMIEWLGANRGLEPADAYLLCSTAANLRISEIVNGNRRRPRARWRRSEHRSTRTAWPTTYRHGCARSGARYQLVVMTLP